MTISGHKTRAVFDRYNIVSQDDLKEAASKRQAFNEKMAERRLQFGYTQPKSSGDVGLCWVIFGFDGYKMVTVST